MGKGEILMAELIAGKLCFDCSDIAQAKRAQMLGIDPARVLPGGSIKPEDDNPLAAKAVKPAEALGVNQPLAAGGKGRNINILS